MNAAPRSRVVVTRPLAQATGWVERLQKAGLDAVALPLIEIAGAPDPGQLAEAWAGLPSRRLVMFVSPNAVLHFFAARPPGAVWPPGLLAAGPGPGTGTALREAGVAAGGIVVPPDDVTRFDSEALWAQLEGRDWRNAGVLVVRGDGGRDWLAERFAEAGARVATLNAYRRVLPVFEGPAREQLEALAGDPGAVWLFTSSQAVGHLEQAAGAGRWGTARAVATHPRIAAQARRAGFGRVGEAEAGLAAVVACIQSLRP